MNTFFLVDSWDMALIGEIDLDANLADMCTDYDGLYDFFTIDANSKVICWKV